MLSLSHFPTERGLRGVRWRWQEAICPCGSHTWSDFHMVSRGMVAAPDPVVYGPQKAGLSQAISEDRLSRRCVGPFSLGQ